MAIKYLDAKRLQGTNAERLALSDETGYVVFDGSGDYATAGSVSNFNFLHDGSSFSVSFWAYRNGSPASNEPQFLATMGATSADTGFGVYMETDGDLIIMYGGGSFAVTTAVNIPDTTWTHITITQSGTSLKWYKNGALEQTVSTSGGSGNSAYVLNFARNPHGGGTVLNCRISDVGMWEDHVLSDDDIDKLSGTNGQSVTRITDDGTGFDYSSSNIVHHWTLFTDYTDSKGSLNGTASGDPTFATAGSPTTSTYPSLPNGTIFNETDAYKYFMFDGTDTWNQMVSS